MTKFGTHIDWFRFWNQFESEIDKKQIDSITKFNYLKEFLDPKARLLIENLMHDTEGYERAKQILIRKFWKPSERASLGIYGKVARDFWVYKDDARQVGRHLGRFDRFNENWQEWRFPQLVDALIKWTERNPIEHEIRQKIFTATQVSYQRKTRVYCGNVNHKSGDCKMVEQVSERRNILRQKKLCFNCTGSGHRAVACESKGSCRHCKGKHHTSVCIKSQRDAAEALLVKGEQSVIYPVVLCDLDHNGQLTSKEIGAAFKKLGHNLSEDELRKIIKEVDTNKNGTIDFDEFVEIYKSSVVVVGPSASKEPVEKRDEK
eukprot:gene16557-18234_t